jgi:hypothetical protein
MMEMDGGIFCGGTSEENLEMRQYFDTLPSYVQTTLQECGMSFGTLKELQACAQNMEKKS